MAKRAKRTAADEPRVSAVFVRIPTEQAAKLDRAAFELGASKRELIAGLVERYVDPGSAEGLLALRGLGRGGAGADRVVVEAGGDPLVVGRHSFRADDPPEVLTAAQAADLLQVDEEAVLALAAAGELPGRTIADQWRFSRRALLDWLAGEPSADG
jgi:excisionase family DNA binding protein